MSAGPSSELAALLARVGTGDRVAFRALYVETSPKLFGIIRRIVRDPGKSEDVLQDVFARIWQAAGGFDAARGTPMGWLAAMARHRAIDLVRRDQGARGEFADTAAAAPAGLDLADAQLLARCLGELDAEQGRAVVLAYRDGWSREELAAAFAKPVGTVKSWLHRCLATLRACMTAHG